jgi:hypothetical protein
VRAGVEVRELGVFDQRGEGIRVISGAPVAVAVLDEQTVVAGKVAGIASEFEQIGVADAFHGTLLRFHENLSCARQKNTDERVLAFPVPAEDRERVVMPRLEQAYGVGIARGETACASVGSDR